MEKDTVLDIGTENCDSCGKDVSEEPLACLSESSNQDDKGPGAKLIDFKQRSSELRIKGLQSGAVTSLEAARGLAFGLMYLNGEGAARDPAKAAPFLTIAAQGGIAQAKHELAQLHLAGVSVPYDAEYAIQLLESASDDDYVASTLRLVEIYIFGKHCPKDTDKALQLLYTTIGRNEPATMYYLAYIYDKDPDYANEFEAAYWYRRAAEHGHFKSQIRLAALYATGHGVPHCPETAEAFLDAAMETTIEQDPRFLLWQGERFEGRPETEFLAQALIKAAAEMQYTPAQRVVLQRGWGGKR